MGPAAGGDLWPHTQFKANTSDDERKAINLEASQVLSGALAALVCVHVGRRIPLQSDQFAPYTLRARGPMHLIASVGRGHIGAPAATHTRTHKRAENNLRLKRFKFHTGVVWARLLSGRAGSTWGPTRLRARRP